MRVDCVRCSFGRANNTRGHCDQCADEVHLEELHSLVKRVSQVLAKVGRRSQKIGFHSYGCATRGKEVPRSRWGECDEDILTQPLIYGSCDCGWQEDCSEFNDVQKKVEEMIEIMEPTGD